MWRNAGWMTTSLCALMLLNGSAALADEVRTYPVNPREGASAPYRVQADGTSLPLEKAGERQVVYYTRFTGVSEATIRVELKTGRTLTARVQPDHAVNDVNVDGNGLSFHIKGSGPRLIFLEADGKPLPHLFVILEPQEKAPPKPGDPEVINVVDYGVTPGDAIQTDNLQRALNECAKRPRGGVVYVPPGHYYTGTLRVGDNTYLYLAGGAVLQAPHDPKHIPVFPGDKEHGGNGVAHSFSRLLLFDHAVNARLGGRGTLDASGIVLRNKHGRRCQVIDAHGCENLIIEGIVARNSGSWTIHLVKSDGVHVRDVKVITDWDVANSDGINPDSCRNVLIERAFCYTSDDSFAVKATRNSNLHQNVANITIRDSVVMTRKTALKVGTETWVDSMSNILFDNIDVVRTSRAIGLWARDGAVIENVIWRNIRADLVEVHREGRSGQPFYIMVNQRRGQSRLRNILIENVTCEAPWYSLLETNVPWPLTDVTFRNIHLKVTPRHDKKDVKYLFEFKGAKDIVFENVTVDWTETQPERWHGLWADDAPVVTHEIKQIGSHEPAE